MNKEVTMTIRVEPELRSRFSRAAEAEHRPASQVLRDLMREYVERPRPPAQPLISGAERRLREEAVHYGIASVALEGFSVPGAYTAQAERFIRGEIEFPALLATVDKIAQAT